VLPEGRGHHGPAMRKRRSLLLVLSHMRSYSSVLSHVLGSHPEIDGYCETHIRYRFALDVHRLSWKVRSLTGEPLSGRFVLDKVLHNYALARRLVSSPHTRAVFLLRRPVQALQSILYMGRHLDSNDRTADLNHAASYYIRRLERLTQLAPIFGQRAAFIASEDLARHTSESLCFLEDFLGLNSPLTQEYRRFRKTGAPGYGDPSSNIQTGELRVRETRRPCYPIPVETIEGVVEAYGKCLHACMLHCATLSGSAAAFISQSRAQIV
jgi:hypothetical protein